MIHYRTSQKMNKRRNCVGLFGFYLLVNLSLVGAISRPSTIVFENNQFKNVVIAIHESVSEDKTLIDTLKTKMTQASNYLYKATRQRAYFREITILLPATWSDDAAYSAPTKESLQLADVVITNPSKSKRSLPQTRSYSGCGKQGVHVLLTKEFLTDESVDPYTNNSAKYFVHAFAQFRWGVFQEYAEAGETEYYFSISEGRADAIKCSIGMKGLFVRDDTSTFTICYPQTSIDPSTGLYFPHCKWKPYPTRQRIKASIMDHQYITMIETFCDDNTSNHYTIHNYEAPSKHNRLCGHRSTWDIITNTTDFKNNINPPTASTLPQSQLTPTFKLMKARSRRRRAVVAVETPILIDDSKNQITDQIRRFLHDHRVTDTAVGLVHYSNTSRQLLPVMKLDTFTEIPSLRGSVAENEQGDVNATEGIVMALQTLQARGPEDGSSIILIAKNHSQFTHSALKLIDQLNDRGVDVHIIRVGDDEEFDLPVDLSGFHDSHHPGTTVYDHLSSVFNEMSSEQKQYITVLREDILLDDEKRDYQGLYRLDTSLCHDAIVSFHIIREDKHVQADDRFPTIWLESPHGKVVAMDSENCVVNKELMVVQYRFHSVEAGIWRYHIQTNSESYQISVTVKAKHSPLLDESPIVIRHQIQTNFEDHNIAFFCDVTRGNHPVIGLKITAVLAKHGGSAETIDLWDNGAGADTAKNDGVYSRYVTVLQKGTYHVTYIVVGENGHVWSQEEILDNGSSDNIEEALKRKITKRQIDGAVQRHVYGGSFRLQNDLHGVTDIVPPSRIADLKVIQILSYRNSLALSWTAPGDDLDTGKVSSYELFVGRNIKDVRDILQFAKTGYHEKDIVNETIPASKSAGETEVFLWNMGDISKVKSFAFAIRALDEVGNMAAISNVATTGFSDN